MITRMHAHTHAHMHARTHTCTHTHTTRKVKPGRSNISGFTGARDSEWQWHLWAMCKSAPWIRRLTMLASHHLVYTGWMLFLLPKSNQQRQSTEGNSKHWLIVTKFFLIVPRLKLLTSVCLKVAHDVHSCCRYLIFILKLHF